MKTLLRNLASLEAVQKVSGVIVRSKSEVAMSSERTSDRAHSSSSFQQRIRAQANGLVSLSVTEESINAERSILKADAKVCVPRDVNALKESVYIQTFISSKGEELVEGTKILEATFSSSRSFIPVTDPADGEWRIDGRISSVDVRTLEVGRSVSTNPLLSLGTVQDSYIQRIHIKGFVQATNNDGEKIVEWFDKSKNLAANRDAADVLEIWTPQLIVTTTQQLEERLRQNRGGQPAVASPRPRITQDPKW